MKEKKFAAVSFLLFMLVNWNSADFTHSLLSRGTLDPRWLMAEGISPDPLKGGGDFEGNGPPFLAASFPSFSKEDSSEAHQTKVGFWPKQFTIRRIEGNENQVPLPTNYTTLGIVLGTDYQPGNFLQFLDLRGHRFDTNQYGFNVGLGIRYVPKIKENNSMSQILGLNVYYDYNQTHLGYFEQVGVGLEVLSRRWDFRANAYLPFGKKKSCVRCVFDDYEGGYYAENQLSEEITYSFNGEVGFLALDYREAWFIYIAGGPYYIAGRNYGNSARGGEFRIRPQYKDYVAFDASVRYDSLFKLVYQFQFIFNIPLYQLTGQNKQPAGLTDRQIYQPVERFEVLPFSSGNFWITNWE